MPISRLEAQTSQHGANISKKQTNMSIIMSKATEPHCMGNIQMAAGK